MGRLSNIDDRSRKLQAAVRSNDWQRVKELLEAGADPDTEGPFGAILFTAMLLGHVAVARMLVEAGADVNVTDDKGWTPLHWAAKVGDRELFGLMVEADGHLLALDNEGNTPLDILSEYRHDGVLEMVRRRYPKEFRMWWADRRE
jgi:ankyrin repeat protein